MDLLSTAQTGMNGWVGPSGKLMSYISKLGEYSSILYVIMFFCVLMIFMTAKSEDKKGLAAYLALLFICVAIRFGMDLNYASIGIMLMLSVVLVFKVKKGNSKGVLPIILVIWFLSTLVSINYWMFAGLFLGAVGVMLFSMKRNHDKKYGTGQERHLMSEEGFSPRKTLRLEKPLEKIGATIKGSKDKVVAGAKKVTALLARREAENLELLTHEEAMAAGAKKIGQTLDSLEQGEISLEQKDHQILNVLEQKAKWIDNQLAHVGAEALDEERAKPLLAFAKQMLKDFAVLIENRRKGEHYREKALKIIDGVLDIVVHAAEECRMLKEPMSHFKHIKAATATELMRIKGELVEERKKLEHITAKTHDAKQELGGVHRRIEFLKQEEHKLDQIRSKLDLVMRQLEDVWRKHNKQIKRIEAAEKDIKSIKNSFRSYTPKFRNQDKKLEANYKVFKGKVKDFENEIPDAILVEATDYLGIILDRISTILHLALDLNKNKITPIIEGSTKIVHEVFYLSRASRFLDEAYGHLALAYSEITQTGALITQNKEYKEELDKVFRQQQFEAKEAQVAQRKTVGVQFKVKHAYGFLKKSVEEVKTHVKSLERDVAETDKAKSYTVKKVHDAFNKTIKAEIKKSKEVLAQEKKAKADAEQARTAAQKAKAQVLQARHAA
ncbi:hypothetical protein HN587_06160 [Candidatus Woesearchaeota archaeon]|jgi:hypothetical protein|nr:hypothetical protein [Candidatus Woesearchaeota archaeon]